MSKCPEFDNDPALEETLEDFIYETIDYVDTLQDLALDSDYWDSALDFIIDQGGTQLKMLSQKQRDWAIKIKEDLSEKVAQG